MPFCSSYHLSVKLTKQSMFALKLRLQITSDQNLAEKAWIPPFIFQKKVAHVTVYM
jgi:hypothetical protein